MIKHIIIIFPFYFILGTRSWKGIQITIKQELFPKYDTYHRLNSKTKAILTSSSSKLKIPTSLFSSSRDYSNWKSLSRTDEERAGFVFVYSCDLSKKSQHQDLHGFIINVLLLTVGNKETKCMNKIKSGPGFISDLLLQERRRKGALNTCHTCRLHPFDSLSARTW